MGEIRKQSFYSSIYTYIGFAVGALNTLLLLTPKLGFFTIEQVGFSRLLLDFGSLFSVLAVMGSLTTFIKFFPYHRSALKNENNDLPFIAMMVSLMGTLLLVISLVLFKDFFARKFGEKSALFIENFELVIPFTISVIVFNLLETFAWSVHKTIHSNFAKELLVRIATLFILILYYFKLINIQIFFILFSLVYVPAFMYLGFVIIKDGTIKICTKISDATRQLYRKMLSFTAFHFSAGVFAILPKTIDVFIIASVIGLGSAGVYTIPTYLVTVLEVPQRSMLGIGSSTISEAWQKNDRSRIQSIYSKSSINLFVLGILLFGLLYPNIDNLIRFLGEEYMPIKIIFLILGTAKLIDLAMGLNNLILGFSKYWKLDFFTNLIFILLAVFFTYFLSKKFGMYGTALGGALTMIGYNLLRFAFIYWLMKLQPFTRSTIYALLIGLAAILISILIPYLGNYFIDAAVRAVVFLVLFLPAILYLKISTDINDMYNKAMNKFFKSNK